MEDGGESVPHHVLVLSIQVTSGQVTSSAGDNHKGQRSKEDKGPITDGYITTESMNRRSTFTEKCGCGGSRGVVAQWRGVVAQW